jgi:hypothetical protein
MSESNAQHVAEDVKAIKETVKDRWDGLTTQQKFAVVGTVVAVGYSVVYIRKLRTEVTNLNGAVAYLLKEQGYFPVKK